MLLSYKFRIYPSKTIEAKLNEQLELCRWLYNRLLEETNKARKEGRKITRRDTQALIPKLKKEKPELKSVYKTALRKGTSRPILLKVVPFFSAHGHNSV